MKRLIIALICQTFFLQVWAQNDMLVTTTANSSMVVCGGEVTFTVHIQNTAGALLEDIRLNPGLVSGVTYVPGSATNMTETTPLSTDNPRFFLPNIAAGDILTVTFRTKADCRLINYIRSNFGDNPAVTAPVRNATTLTYNKGGTIDLVFAEPNGSESYNVAYADLEISVNGSDINQTGSKPDDTFERRISVRNSGLGSTGQISFYVKVPTDMQLLKMRMVNQSGGVIQILSPAAVVNGKYRYDINSFTGTGDGDALLEQNETVFFKDSVQAVTCSASLETQYSATWGCQSAVCNDGALEALTNAYVTIPSGNATVNASYTVINSSGVSWCSAEDANIHFILSNTGATASPVLQGVFNIQLNLVTDIRTAKVQNIYLSNNTDITHLITSRTTEGNTEFITLNFDDALGTNPGAQTGLTDLDGDGFFDDLAPGKTLTLPVTMDTYRPQGIDQCAGTNLVFRIFQNTWSYTESCGNTESTPPVISELKYEPLEEQISGNANPQAGVTERYTFKLSGRLNTGIFNCPSPVYKSTFTVPRGLIIQQAFWKSTSATSAVSVPYTTQADTIITIESQGGLEGEYYLDFQMNCAQASSSAVGTITWNMEYQCSSSCTDEKLSLACETKEIFNPCVSCASFITSFFSFERFTFGWEPPVTGKYRYDELFGNGAAAPRIDRTRPGIRLDAAYPYDVVQLQARGKLSETSAAFSNAHVSLSYETTAGLGMLFDFIGGSLSLNGTSYNFQDGYTPTVTQQGIVTTIDFNLPLGTNGIPATITPGMSVDVIANFSVKPLTSLTRGAYALQRLRLQHYGQSGSTISGCNSIESKFSVLKPEARIAAASSVYQCEDQVYLLRMAFTSATTATGSLRDDFPLEFRPMAYLTQFTATAPTGYTFDPAKPVLLTFLESNVTYTIPGVQFSNGNRTIRFTRDNSFPVSDIDDDFDDDQFVIANMIPDCTNENNLFQPPASGVIRTEQVSFTAQYLSSAYLTDATRHLAQSSAGTTTSSNYRNVDMALIVNATQEGIGEEVRWPVSLCNQNALPFSVVPGHNWIAVELKPEDQSILLKGAALEDGTALPVVFYGAVDASHPQGRFMLVKLESIPDATCKNLEIIANYINCVEDKTQILDVYSSWNCKGYPEVSAATSSIAGIASCEIPVLQNDLNLRFKTANLQWAVTRTGPDVTALCSNVPFTIDITSSRYADLNQVYLRLELPPGVMLAANEAPTFTYPLSGSAQPIPPALMIVEGNRISWKIDDIIGMPLPGTHTPDNAIRIHLSVTPNCSVDPGLPVIFRAEARTNCGDPLALADQRKIRIAGIPLDELTTTINATAYSFCERTNIIEATVRNTGATVTAPEQFTITLPAGVSFTGLTDNSVGQPVVTAVGGETVLTWNLPSGYLLPGAQRTFGLRTTIQAQDFETSKTIRAKTVINGQATCVGNGDNCPLVATTSTASLPVTYDNNRPGVTLTASPAVTVCSGTTVTLTATLSNNVNPANYTFTWSEGGASGPVLNVTATQSKSYIVTAQSPTGCVAKDTIAINILPAVAIGSVLPTATTCAGSEDGVLSFTLSGGAGPFSYTVQKPGGGTISAQTGGNVTLNGLATGNYLLLATNAEGCQASRSVTILNGGPTFSICTSTLPCDASGGEISRASIRVNRIRPQATGVFSYRILKNGTETVHSGEGSFGATVLHDLVYEESATYTVELLAGAGDNTCTLAPVPVTLRKAQLTVTLNDADAVYEKCYAGQQVAVTASSSLNLSACTPAATNQFSYQLYQEGVPSGNAVTAGNTHTFTLSAPGNYSIETTSLDPALGTCLLSRAFRILESTMEVSVQTVNATCSGLANGSAQAVVSGGQPPYNYQWFNAEGTLLSRLSGLSTLAPGNYSVAVTDSRGCDVSARKDFTITTPDPLGVLTFTLPTNLTCNVTAQMTPPGGTAPYTFYWIRIDTISRSTGLLFASGSATLQYSKSTLENLVYTDRNPVLAGNTVSSATTSDVIRPGVYKVRVTDANGCQTESPVQTISQPPVNRTYQLCFRWKSTAEPEETVPDPDIKVLNGATIASAALGKAITEKTNQCIAGKMAEATSMYLGACFSADHLDDAVTLQYSQKEYHYTLYYYDRGGNLLRTVPPKGVIPLVDNISRANHPSHRFVSEYDYNSLAQLVTQQTPDGGVSNSIYNNLGQIRFSQNAQEAEKNQVTYSKYDALGRISETGKLTLGGTYSPDGSSTVYDVSTFNALKNNALIRLDEASYETLPMEQRFPLRSAAITEYVVTRYNDAAEAGSLDRPQRYLRNHVSYVQSFDLTIDAEPVTTVYSYDPHGNMEWLVQKIPGLDKKEITYAYDLISNKVLQTNFNEGKKDQFFHRYVYDEDNRLLSVSTSSDAILWDRDVRYSYYKHGPVRRAVMGEDQVQGIDYVFTIHGWLKGINYPSANAVVDPGHDGKTTVPADVFSMGLYYFQGDFASSQSQFSGNGLLPGAAGRDLFNGNISSWTTRTLPVKGIPDGGRATGMQFTYDRLNRIKASDFYRQEGSAWQSSQDFRTRYTYDGNGNIQTLERNAVGAATLHIDSLAYHYYPGTNQLAYVTDRIDSAVTALDVDDQEAGNYHYDAIGNLVANASDSITAIEWTMQNKVRSVMKSDGTQTRFRYDANGNRVMKQIIPAHGDSVTTFYVRDAAGNTLSVYEQRSDTTLAADDSFDRVTKLLEQPLYGGERLGQHLANQEIVRTRYVGGVGTPVEENTIQIRSTWSPWNLPSQAAAGSSLTVVNVTGENPQRVGSLPVRTGNRYSQVATGRNEAGEIIFHMAVADNAGGVVNTVYLLDKNGNVMPGINGTTYTPAKAKGGGFSHVFRIAGNNHHHIATVDATGKAWIHTIDMTQPGNGTQADPLGAVVATNQPLDGGRDYVQGMALIQDNRQTPEAHLYMVRKSTQSGKLELVVHTFNGSIVPEIQVVETVDAYPGGCIAKVSPDAQNLAIMVPKGEQYLGDITDQGMQLRLYDLADDLKHAALNTFYTVADTAMMYNFEFDSIAQYIYYAQFDINGRRLCRKPIRGGDTDTLRALNSVAHVMRAPNGKLYLAERSRTFLVEITPGETATLRNVTLTLPTSHSLSGALPQQPVVLKGLQAKESFAFYRNIGKKRYELKDHLGGVRAIVTDLKRPVVVPGGVIFTAEIGTAFDYYPFGMQMPYLVPGDSATYLATLEDSRQSQEAADFGASYTAASRIASPLYNHTRTADVADASRATRLSGVQQEIIGLSKALQVSAGDSIKMEVFAKYLEPASDAPGTSITTFIASSFTGSFGLTAAPETKPLYDYFNDLFAAGPLFAPDNTDNVPDAYLNYLLFDKNYVLMDAGYQSISEAALEDGTQVLHEKLAMEVVPAQEGYLYVYLSNESARISEVFFDDFRIVHTATELSDEGRESYRYAYNGKEKDSNGEFGDTHYDYGFRIYNPAIARFLSVDPLTKDFPWYTPYQFAGNTPIQAIDLDGLEPVNLMTGKVIQFPAQENLKKLKSNDYGLWQDMLQWEKSDQYKKVYDKADEGRILDQQEMDWAASDRLNTDYYAVKITKLPEKVTAKELYESIRKNYGKYMKAEGMENQRFSPNRDRTSKGLWNSDDPTGSIMVFRDFRDNAAVLTSQAGDNHWVFSPVGTAWHWEHPLAGHREFGLTDNGDGTYTFYTRGVDMLWDVEDVAVAQGMFGFFEIADRLWNRVMDNIAKEINENGGAATKTHNFTRKIDWEDDVKEEDK